VRLGLSKKAVKNTFFPFDFSIPETPLRIGWNLVLWEYSHVRLDFFWLLGKLPVVQNSIVDL